MQVFRDAIAKNGGPLPLAYYLQPDAGGAPDAGPQQCSSTIDLLNTRVDRRSFFECLMHDKNFAILNTFLVSGVPVNAVRAEDGATALHIAAAATLDMLDDAALTGVRGDGTTAMSTATTASAMDASDLEEDARHRADCVLNPPCPNQLIINFLIDNGANVNAPMQNQLRQTPLMVAAARQNIKVAKLLLAKDADMSAQDALGRTALTYAARYPLLLEAFRVWMGEENFCKAAAQEQLLHTVCRTVGNHYAALYLIEQVHLDVNARDSVGVVHGGTFNTAAAAAASGSGSGAAAGAGANRPSSPSPPARSSIPAATAAGGAATAASPAVPASNGGLSVALLSPRNGAAGRASSASAGKNRNTNNTSSKSSSSVAEIVNVAALSGDTPLHYAVGNSDVALVRALLSKGADVHAENGSGVTPLRLTQSHTQVGPSRKQYWKEELLLLLQPNSPGALAARRRRRDQQERNPAKVRAILNAYNNATPGPSREKVLQEETAQYIWQVCTPMDYAQFAATVLLPHLGFYLCCCVLRNFFLLLCLLPLLYGSYIGMQRRDGHHPRSRPLTGIGWCFGYVVMQGICLPLFTTRYYYQYYSFDLEDHAAISWWLIPSAVLAFVLLVYLVLFSSPGVVTTTEGQRKGIYASLRNAKGNYPKELLYGIDLRTMVRKPLRAQYCVELQRVVLRFDQYCAYLSTAIGGGNQRVFFLAHVALLALLSCFYHYAREYSRLMSRIADVARTSGGAGGRADQAVLKKMAVIPFSTAELRFGYMYTQVILPIMILMVVYALYNQLCLIARNLTAYDLEHAEQESSIYCFNLGSTTYSLYDHGIWANVREFFGWSSFTQLVYRVPQINPHLQKIIEDHQRWQLTSDGGCGCDDGHHGHSHGQGSATATAATDGEQIGPAEYGDDESTRTQQMLEAKQRQAVAAAQSNMRAAAAGAAAPATVTALATGAPQPQAQQQRKSAAVDAAHAPVWQATEKEEKEREAVEESYKEGEEEQQDEAAAAHSALVLQIFQQMVRSGSTDVGRGGDNVQGTAAAYGVVPVNNNSGNNSGGSGSGGGGGADAETQREWDAAVLQARQMFDFYRQSLGAEGED